MSLIKPLRARVTVDYIIREAGGPNPTGAFYEVIDPDGIRLSYADTLEQAIEDLHEYLADSIGTFELDTTYIIGEPK